MIKRYKIEYDWWNCVIEFDTSKFDNQLLEACLDFYSWDYNTEGDLYEEYAKKLAGVIINYSMDCLLEGIIRNFEEEGMPILDGSNGVTLISCENWEFDDNAFENVEL